MNQEWKRYFLYLIEGLLIGTMLFSLIYAVILPLSFAAAGVLFWDSTIHILIIGVIALVVSTAIFIALNRFEEKILDKWK